MGLLRPVTNFVKKGDSWLTLGDLQYGRDAFFLKSKVAQKYINIV